MKIKYFIIPAILITAIIACSSNNPPDLGTAQLSDDSDEGRVRRDIINLFERMIEGDKTVLYENEFEYYRNEWTLDDYYSFKKIMVYQYDTMKAITVDSVKIIEDTAIAFIQVIYEYRAGGDVTESYPVKMYRDGERWIKPSMSYRGLQIEYEAFKKGEEEAEEFENSGGN